VIKDLFCLLWVSKEGLTDTELIDVLGVSRMTFSGVFTAIQDMIISRSGLLNFYHDDLRKAVERKYLSDEGLKRKYYVKLADYFESFGSLDRRSQELPWCLFQSKSWYRLCKCLREIDAFYALCTKMYKWELKRYWNAILEDHNVAVEYIQSLEEYENTKNPDKKTLSTILMRLGKFLKEMLQYEGAEQLLLKSLQLNESIFGKEHEIVAKNNYIIAQVNWNQGKWDRAEPYCLKSLEVRERLHGPDSMLVAKCLTGLGELWIERNPQKARPLLERAMEILTKKLGRDHQLVSRLMHDLATIYDSFGQHQEAVSLHMEAITIREKSLGQNHPQLSTSYEVLGITYKLMREFRKAELAFRKALQINEIVHGEIYTGVASNLEWLVLIYNDLNLPFEADKCEERRRKVQGELTKLGITVGERIVD